VPTVVFAPAIARWLSPHPEINQGERAVTASGATVRELLDDVFARHPVLRGYVVDEHGALRHHVVAFVNDEPVRDKRGLAELVPADAQVYVFQALSGG
jgi:sulfur-carrier protein